jgi:pimeloyl-ACP methyl ester carboxylesterase
VILEPFYEVPTEILTKPRSPSSKTPTNIDTTILSNSSNLTPGVKSSSDLRPETRYAKSGDINIAYQVLGNGPVDLIYVPGWVTHLEYGWEEPSLARFYRELASFSRLILFDKRGTGLSDQSANLPTLEQRMDDVRAVMEAVDSERAVVFGMSEGGNMAMLFAATYPERTIALITFAVFAKRIYEPDYPWAPTLEERQKFYDAIQKGWGGPVGIEDLSPSRADDQQFRSWWASYQRRSASPRAALILAQLNTSIDVRHVLPAIRVPTLVMHRTGDCDAKIEEGRYIAAHIPGAKLVELAGADHLLWTGDQDAVLREVESFIGSIGENPEVDSILATGLYITAKSTADRDLDRFHPLAIRETEWFKGRVSEAGNHAFFATFDGPIRAIRCAKAIRDSALEVGIETKAGLHTGLCEMRGDKSSGPPVEISKRLADLAAAGEVLLTNAVVDLVSGSDVSFTDRGTFNIEGVPKHFRVFSAV